MLWRSCMRVPPISTATNITTPASSGSLRVSRRRWLLPAAPTANSGCNGASSRSSGALVPRGSQVPKKGREARPSDVNGGNTENREAIETYFALSPGKDLTPSGPRNAKIPAPPNGEPGRHLPRPTGFDARDARLGRQWAVVGVRSERYRRRQIRVTMDRWEGTRSS